MAKNNRLLIYGGVAVLAVAGFVMTSPPDTLDKNAGRKTSSGKSSARGVKIEVFTEEDEKATFVRLNEPTDNAFDPIVKQKSSSSSSNSLPNQIPPEFVGGKLTWFFTGTAYINDVPTATIENTATGTWEYLRVGQKFMDAKVEQITPMTVVLSGVSGTKTVKLMDDRPIIDDYADLSGSQPLNPLAGPIGLEAAKPAPVIEANEPSEEETRETNQPQSRFITANDAIKTAPKQETTNSDPNE